MTTASDPATSTVRAVLGALVDDMERIEALIFTTYVLAAPFVEDSILGLLANEKFKLSTLNEIQGASDFCDKANVAVFYDAHATTALEKRATFDTFPVFVKNGAFHPKIILAFGYVGERPTARLMVGSANLTLSGWARNREVIAAATVMDQGVAGPLLQLLDWLFESQGGHATRQRERYAAVLSHLEGLPKLASGSRAQRLFVSLPDTNTSLMAMLAAAKPERLLIAAPFFSAGSHGYLRNSLGDTVVLELVPAKDADGEVPLLNSDVAAFWDDERAQVGFLNQYMDEQDERFDHFKLFAWDDTAIIGSHNATIAALGYASGGGHLNVEVSISAAIAPETLTFKSYDEPPPGKRSEEALSEDLPSQRLPGRIDVVADWRRRVYIVEVDESLGGYWLRLPGIEERIALSESVDIPFTPQTDIELLSRRWFEVLQTAPAPIYRGYINELHWRGFRQEAVMESLTACLDAWVSGVTVEDGIAAELIRPLSEQLQVDREERLEPIMLDHPTGDVFENYFRLFRATRSFWDDFSKRLDVDDVEGAARHLHAAPGSLRRVIELIEEDLERSDEDTWSTYQFILIQEVARITDEAKALVNSRGDEDLATTLQGLAQRAERLRERLIKHPVWQAVKREESGAVLTFIVEELGYVVDSN